MELKINDRIRTRKVERFNEFALTLRYDSVASSFSFNAFFNPDNPAHKDLFCIGHYHICTLSHKGELLITGVIVSTAFNDSPEAELASFGGYSSPGILEHVNVPYDIYPLESAGLNLREIASKLLKPFGLGMIIHSTVSELMEQPYDKSTAEPTQSIKEYLASLAGQKNIVISHDAKGNVVFTLANTGKKPILDFDATDQNSIPFTNMSLDFDGDGMHSHIQVIKQANSKGGNAGEFLIRNPYVINTVFRPKVVIQNSGSDVDTEKVARMALSDELRNLKLTIQTDRWQLADGKIIKPDNLITVKNPKVYLYKKSTWFVEAIEFKGNNEKVVATLTCCLPEVYNEKTPVYLFQGINLH